MVYVYADDDDDDNPADDYNDGDDDDDDEDDDDDDDDDDGNDAKLAERSAGSKANMRRQWTLIRKLLSADTLLCDKIQIQEIHKYKY